MTLISIVTVLAIKSYTINAQDRPVNDVDLEMMASEALLNKADTIRHQKMIKRFVKGIEGADMVYGRYAGSADFPTSVFENYERIQRVATVQELNELVEHDSPVVRVYAHRALMENNMSIQPIHLESLIADTTEIMMMNGLEISKVRVMDVVAQNIFQKEEETE
jgi:hypothetical protein